MPAVATQAGASFCFGAGTVATPATVVAAAVVHCLRRREIPERAVRPAPLPWQRHATMFNVRVAPGLRKNCSNSEFAPELVWKESSDCLLVLQKMNGMGGIS